MTDNNKFNEYRIDGDTSTLYYTNRKGECFEILVSTEDLDMLIKANSSWSTAWKPEINDYYATTTKYLGKVNGRFKYNVIELHKFLMNPPEGMVVDHINHNALDNRRCNLRVVSNKQNIRNRKDRNSNNTSGYRNVSKVGNKWIVQLQVNGRNKCLGRFDDAHEAGVFAEKMRSKYYGEFAGRCKGIEEYKTKLQ